MTNETNEQLQKFLEERQERDEQVIQSVHESLKPIFPDEKQHEVICDLFTQVYKLSADLEELNHNGIYTSSYIDAFYNLLVGENKMFKEEEYITQVKEAYQKSIDTLQKVNDSLTPEKTED